jgi:hypothetical protein
MFPTGNTQRKRYYTGYSPATEERVKLLAVMRLLDEEVLREEENLR